MSVCYNISSHFGGFHRMYVLRCPSLSISVNYFLLLLFCRYVSDAVTGVIIVSMLFFFPSQKPSLSWWFDPQGQGALKPHTYQCLM